MKVSFRTRPLKSSFLSSNDSTKAGIHHDGGGKEDILSKAEEKSKGLHDCTFRDVRDISNSQALLKSESSIDMVTNRCSLRYVIQLWAPRSLDNLNF